MSHALGPQTGSDIFRGKFSKITKKSAKLLLRPAWRQIVDQQTIQTAAQCTQSVLCCSAWPNAIFQTKTMQMLVACYRDRVVIFFYQHAFL